MKAEYQTLGFPPDANKGEVIYRGPCQRTARREGFRALDTGRFRKATVGLGDGSAWALKESDRPSPLPSVDAATLRQAMENARAALAAADAGIQAPVNLATRLAELEAELATLTKGATDGAGSGDDFETTILKAGRIGAISAMLPAFRSRIESDTRRLQDDQREADRCALVAVAQVAALAAVPVIARAEREHEAKAAPIRAAGGTLTEWAIRTGTGRGAAAALPPPWAELPIYALGTFTRAHVAETLTMAEEALALLEQAQPAPETRPPTPLRTKVAA